MSGETGHFYSLSETYNNVKSWQYFVVDKLPLSINSSMTITSKNLQNQETIEKLTQHTAYTENVGSNECESEEISPKMNEGRAYKQLLAQGVYVMQAAMTMDAFADEDVGSDSGQRKPQANASGAESSQKGMFRCENKPGVYPLGSEEIEKENDGGQNQKDSEAEEIVSEKETDLAKVTDPKEIRESEEHRQNVDTFFDNLPNRDMNVENEENEKLVKESKRNKQDMSFDSERESVEEPDSCLEGESASQQGTADGFEQPESIEFSNGEKEDDEVETDQNLWYSRKCIEQIHEEETEPTMPKFMAKYDFKCDHLSEIPEEQEEEADLEGNGVEEQEREANEEEEAELLSDDLSDRPEVSEDEGKPGGETELSPEGEGEGIRKEGNSGVEVRRSEEGEEEKGKGEEETERLGSGEKDLEEEKEREQKEREQGRQKERNKGMKEGEEEEQGRDRRDETG